jgi:hypothetical protein
MDSPSFEYWIMNLLTLAMQWCAKSKAHRPVAKATAIIPSLSEAFAYFD